MMNTEYPGRWKSVGVAVTALALWGWAGAVRADHFGTYIQYALARGLATPGQNGAINYVANGAPNEDADGDGLLNTQEYNGWQAVINGQLYSFSDNGNGVPPGAFDLNGPDPTNPDTDGDGLGDRLEWLSNCNPHSGDSDADGMPDPWEVYVGLDPRNNGTWTGSANDQWSGADPDGDGLSSLIEYLGPNLAPPGIPPATAALRQRCPAFGADDYTLPLSFDSDVDRLVDSFEWELVNGLDPQVVDNADLDPDLDGLTTFREMCLHPLLANYQGLPGQGWSSLTPSLPRAPLGYYQVPENANGPFVGASCTLGSGWLNLAQADRPANIWPNNMGNVQWGLPVGFTIAGAFLGGTPRWSDPTPDYGGSDSDGDFLPDGWEVEHGLNPLNGLTDPTGSILQPSGGLGDPDNDGLLNVEEYFGQDGYRIDLRTGTGDETNPWIARLVNRRQHTPFAETVHEWVWTASSHRLYQGPMQYWAVYTNLANTRFTLDFEPLLRPGFFDLTVYNGGVAVLTTPVGPVGTATVIPNLDGRGIPTGTWDATYEAGAGQWVIRRDGVQVAVLTDVGGTGGVAALSDQDGNGFTLTINPPGPYTDGDQFTWNSTGVYVPVAGTPPPELLWDGFDNTPSLYDPFATAQPGLRFVDNNADQFYTTGTDDMFVDMDGDDVFTLGTDILVTWNPLTGGEIGVPVERNVPVKWPMPGFDSDDDGLSDSLEIQADSSVHKEPSSPIHSTGPFTARAALITGTNGLEASVVDAGENGRRFFNRDWTLESWVYLRDQGVAEYSGALVQGRVRIATLDRLAYELGVSNSIPYVTYQTSGGKYYRVSSPALSKIPKGRWTHLAGVFNHHNNSLSLYIDGLLDQAVQNVQESASSFGRTYGGRLVLAKDAGGAAPFANNVWIDEVRVWGVPRTTDEIADNRLHMIDPFQLSPVPPYLAAEMNGLFAYFPFDDGGKMAEDVTRRAKSSMLGFQFPADAGVVAALGLIETDATGRYGEYYYGDAGYAIDSDAIPGTTNFVFDLNNAAPVSGFTDPERGAFDSDLDGLPDAWELVHELNPFKKQTPAHVQAAQFDPNWQTANGPVPDGEADLDGDGLTNYQEYTARTNPRKNDTDENAIPDPAEDFDRDGLLNATEGQYKSRLDLADTDDDGLNDSFEVSTNLAPASSASPVRNLAIRFDGYPGSYLDVPQRAAMRMTSWTIEANVLPAKNHGLADGQGAIIARRTVQQTTNNLFASNFELLIRRLGASLVAEARYVYVDNSSHGLKYSVVSPTTSNLVIQTNRDDNDPGLGATNMTHLAATYANGSGELILYVNGVKAAQFIPADRPPISGEGIVSFFRIGEGFRGVLDEVRLWSKTRLQADLQTWRSKPLLGTEDQLVSYFRLDDGGWPAMQVRDSVLGRFADPGTIASLVDQGRYIVLPAGVGAFSGKQGQIAVYNQASDGFFWTFETPDDGDRAYDYGASATYQYSAATQAWTLAPAEPVTIRSVRYAAAPPVALRMDGDTWLSGASIVTLEGGSNWVAAAPAKLFCEGAMVQGTAADGDFAWWCSREMYYRYDTTLAAGVPTGSPRFKRWGKAVRWLADARYAVTRSVATTNALAALTKNVGDVILVEDADTATAGLQPAFFIYNGAVYVGSALVDRDRVLDLNSGFVRDWSAADLTFIKIADGLTDGGGLYMNLRGGGFAMRSGGTSARDWKRWGYIPTSADFTQLDGWTNQWAQAARLSGGGRYHEFKTSGATVFGGDSDGDGLPDWWEIKYGLDPNDPTGDNGADGDPDGDGLRNINEYRSHLINPDPPGYNPNDADSDDNGKNDGEEDADEDGLSNIVEQDTSLTRIDMIDTDDDFLTDWEEVTGYDFTDLAVWRHATNVAPVRVSNPLSAADPPKQMSAAFNGRGRAVIPNQLTHALKSWTVEAWVYPSNTVGGIVLRRQVTNNGFTTNNVGVNYELALRSNGAGALVPSVRFLGMTLQGTNALLVEGKVDGTNAKEILGGASAAVAVRPLEWTHMAGTYDEETHRLSLYLNGELASYRTDLYRPWGIGLESDSEGQVTSILTVGGGDMTGTNVVGGFTGCIDEVKIVAGAVAQQAIRQDASMTSSPSSARDYTGAGAFTFRKLTVAEMLAQPHLTDRLVVRFKSNVSASQVQGVLTNGGGTMKWASRSLPIYSVTVAANTLTQQLLRLQADANVVYAEPAYVYKFCKTPNDPTYPQQYGLHNTGQNNGTAGADIGGPDAWDRTTGSRDVVVAIIDSGIDWHHPDLAGNIWTNPGEIPDNNVDDDGNGYIDDVRGWDFGDNDNDPMDDVVGHGTHCAGIVGATGNNGVGICGMNWNVRLMPLKIADLNGGLSLDAALQAIEYAWRNGAKISNNSWGGYGYSQALYDAISMARTQGQLFCAASGNDGIDTDGFPHYPSSYDLDNILSVAATDNRDELADFSNYGASSVDIGAPGVAIWSTLPNGTYAAWDGTSMATPYVAGVAALIQAVNPKADFRVMRAQILNTATALKNLNGFVTTGGRLNAAAAVGGTGASIVHYRFDDFGTTAENYLIANDWVNAWTNAARFQGDARFTVTSYLDVMADTDKDGLPDWWEAAVGLNPLVADSQLDSDGDGLINYYEYLAGTNPFARDTDRDGTSDADEDVDGDGLSNKQEQAAGTNPSLRDTDDDGVNDNVEITAGTGPLNSLSPDNVRALNLNGTKRLRVRSEKSTDATQDWTAEAWVQASPTAQTSILVRRAEKFPVAGVRWVDYELGLSNGLPYIAYSFRVGTNQVSERLTADKAIGTNWTHLAGARDTAGNQLRLYVDGKCVNYKLTTQQGPVTVYGVFETLIGGGDLSGSTVTQGFRGKLDAVRVFNYMRTSLEIQMSRDELLPEFVGDSADALRSPQRLFNFDDGGLYAENSGYPKDWITGWQNAAVVEPAGATYASLLVAAPFPPVNLDNDDDTQPDLVEVGNNWMAWRSESPYVPKYLNFQGGGVVKVDEMVDGVETRYYALTNWTVETWVRPRSVTVTNTYVPLVMRTLKDGSYSTFELGLFGGSNGTYKAYARFNRDDAGRSLFSLVGGVNLPVGTASNQWTHVAASYTDGLFRLFVNGAESARSTDTAVRPVVGTGGALLQLGATNFVGDLRDTRIWTAARSDVEVRANMLNSLLFSASTQENSWQGGASYPGRLTTTNEASYQLDYSDFFDYGGFVIRYGHVTTPWTVQSWVRLNAGAGGGTVAERRVQTGTAANGNPIWAINHSLRVGANGQPQGYMEGLVTTLTPTVDAQGNVTQIQTAIGQRDYTLTSDIDIRDGQWHHIAFTGDGQRLALYVDGVLDRQSATYYTLLDAPGAAFESLYRSYDTLGSVLRIGEGFAGVIDEVAFWNIAQPVENIARMMQFGLTRADVRQGLRRIDPLPAEAIDDGIDHRPLVSYVTFDGQITPPWVQDQVSSGSPYRMLPQPAAVSVLADSRPPVQVDRVRAFDGVIRGMFTADDGGAHIENYMERNDYCYAGQFYGGVRFLNFTATDGAPTKSDTDGDGLPDWWESANGLDPADGTGINGAWGDPDGDGLNNRAEYLAGTDPWDWDTDGDGDSDYDDHNSEDDRSPGERFDDGDGIPDNWENQYPGALSPMTDDAAADADADGWSNWAEFMANTSPIDQNEYPRPEVRVNVRFNGAGAVAPVRFEAYTRKDMNGAPDAAGVVARPAGSVAGSFPFEGLINAGNAAVAANAMAGHLREGDNWLFFFSDSNGNNRYDQDEPAGITSFDNPAFVGYVGPVALEVGLQVMPTGFGRFSWAPAAGAGSYTVRVRTHSGVQVLEKTILPTKTYVSEGDYWDAGIFGLSYVQTYDWFVYTVPGGVPYDQGSFRVDYAPIQQPVATYPSGATLNFAQNYFTWTGDTNSTLFRLTIWPVNTANPPLGQFTFVPPHRELNGQFRYRLPIYAGDAAFTNGNYVWQIQGWNPLVGWSAASASATFSVNMQAAPAGALSIAGSAVYGGKVKVGSASPIVVQAFANAGCGGAPLAQSTVTNKVNRAGVFALRGLRTGTYYVRAFIDQNGNRLLDEFESWGFVKVGSPQDAQDYTPKAIAVTTDVIGERLVIRDRDTDTDSLPDGWEYMNWGTLSAATATTDSDGDGLLDLREYEIDALDTDPRKSDTDGDGLSDFYEVTWSDRVAGRTLNPNSYMPFGGALSATGYDLNPLVADTDADGLVDGAEIAKGANPMLRDTDGDGVPDGMEVARGADPLRGDSDGDGYPDGLEIASGSNPTNSAVHPAKKSLFKIDRLVREPGQARVRFGLETGVSKLTSAVGVTLECADGPGGPWTSVPAQTLDANTSANATTSWQLTPPVTDVTVPKYYRLRWELK